MSNPTHSSAYRELGEVDSYPILTTQTHRSILHRLFKFLLQILYSLKNPLQSKYLLMFLCLCACKRQYPYANLFASAFMHALMLLCMHIG